MKKYQKKCAECGIEWKDAKSKHYSYKLEKYVCDKCVLLEKEHFLKSLLRPKTQEV